MADEIQESLEQLADRVRETSTDYSTAASMVGQRLRQAIKIVEGSGFTVRVSVAHERLRLVATREGSERHVHIYRLEADSDLASRSGWVCRGVEELSGPDMAEALGLFSKLLRQIAIMQAVQTEAMKIKVDQYDKQTGELQ